MVEVAGSIRYSLGHNVGVEYRFSTRHLGYSGAILGDYLRMGNHSDRHNSAGRDKAAKY